MPEQPTAPERIRAIQSRLDRSELQDALTLNVAALRHHPRHPRLIAQRLTILRQMGRDDDALAFAEALPEEIRTGKVLHLVAALLSDFGRLDEAEALFNRAQPEVRTMPGYLLGRVRLISRRHGLAEGLAACRRMRGDQGPPQLLREEAQILLSMGQPKAALDLLTDMLDREPDVTLLQSILRQALGSGQTAQVHKHMTAEAPRRIARLEARFQLPAALPDEARSVLERAAHSCPVHQSLHPDVELGLEFVWG